LKPWPWRNRQPAPDWKVVARDGLLEIVDQDGHQPFGAADEDERIDNLFLAASAPRLYDALGIALNRLEHLASVNGSGYSGVIDRRILQQGHAALIDARPSPGSVAALRERDRQLNLFGSAG